MFAGMTFIAWLVSALAMSASWIKLCSTAEDHITDGTKRRLRRWFAPQEGDDGEQYRWPDGFIAIFDAIFGERFVSWKFFLRSCLATLVIFTTLAAIFLSMGAVSREGFWVHFDYKQIFPWWLGVLIIAVAILTNLVSDYVSVMQTRLFLQAIRNRPVWTIPILLVDCVLNLVIFLLFLTLLWSLMMAGLTGSSIFDVMSWISGLRIVDGALVVLDNSIIVGIWKLVSDPTRTDEEIVSALFQVSLLTTYFTSVWIWLFVVSGVIGRAVFVVKGRLTRFGRHFKVNEKPLTTVGYVLALITFVLHVTFFAGWHIWQAVTPPSHPLISETAS